MEKNYQMKIRLIVTFMALLEMLREGQISIEQDNAFEEIIIIGCNNG